MLPPSRRISFVLATSLPMALWLAGCPTSHDTSPDTGGARDAPVVDAPDPADVPTPLDAPAPPDAPATDGGGGTDAPSSASGDCATDADCPGGTCVELVPGGYRVCRTPRIEQTACTMPSIDQCCTTADCTTGACYLGPIVETCGGPSRLPFNECASDMCADDSDCTGADLCAPAGTFAPVAVCISGGCHLDADCTAEAGGRCVVARDPCCGIARGLYCAYASDGCRTNADCTGGAYCAIDGVRARCVNDGGPICPL